MKPTKRFMLSDIFIDPKLPLEFNISKIAIIYRECGIISKIENSGPH